MYYVHKGWKAGDSMRPGCVCSECAELRDEMRRTQPQRFDLSAGYDESYMEWNDEDPDMDPAYGFECDEEC